MARAPLTAALIIPTGIGASIGGFGGDAMTLLPLFSEVCDTVITHPNVANAACFQTLPDNALYVEGYALDRYFAGDWMLQPVLRNRVGVVWDSGISDEMRTLHLNTLGSVQTVYGVDIVGIEETTQPVDLGLELGPSGRSAGYVRNAEVLIEAARKLIAQGATAIAVCCLFPAEIEESDAYLSGKGVDPIGGLEAMISHAMVAELQIRVAHVPVFSWDDAHPVLDRPVDPRAASEFIVPTFLPCVLTGLARAPQFSTQMGAGFSIDTLSALVVPADALGSLPVLACASRGIPIFAVENNQTVMNSRAEALGLLQAVTPCHSYPEALGHLVALKRGIQLPAHITRPAESASTQPENQSPARETVHS